MHQRISKFEIQIQQMEDQLANERNEDRKKNPREEEKSIWSSFLFIGLFILVFIILVGLIVYSVYQYDNQHDHIIVQRYYEIRSTGFSNVEYAVLLIVAVVLFIFFIAGILEYAMWINRRDEERKKQIKSIITRRKYHQD